MSEANFTPGPWSDGVFEWDILDKDDRVIAQACADISEFVENASLIKAAPDLYAVCQTFVDYYPFGINPQLDSAVAAARAALAKAHGES